MMNTNQQLLKMIEERGWRGTVVPIGHIDEIRDAVVGRYEQGLIDESLYRNQLSWFSFDLPDDLPNAQSIIAVAVPVPQSRVFFSWNGRRFPVTIPPTYVSYTPRINHVQTVLAAWLREHGFSLAAPKLPLKTLAVRSGLAEYGRNNITYVSGMGSFHELVGAYSDIPCEDDPWREPKALDLCESCVACLHSCPTGAIDEDRFLLHAEICLTNHNEAAGDFADWIDPSWHHCLIGCMRCQASCPENAGFLNRFDDRAEFSEGETALLLAKVPFEKLPNGIAKKLKSLEINEEYVLLCRNLAAVLEQAKCTV